MPKTEKKYKDERSRNWSIIAYPESACENFREILHKHCKKFTISPLHDRDLNEDGTLKKPHWHIVLLFDSKKSYAQIKQISDEIKAAPPQKVISVQAMLDYQCHLNNPEKAQYEISQVYAVGINYEKEIMGNSEFIKHIRAEIFTMIQNENIKEYADLLDRLQSVAELDEHFDYACKHTILFRGYLNSSRNRPQKS